MCNTMFRNAFFINENQQQHFNIYITEEIFCEKRNASTPLGIEPRTFRLPVECSVIGATEVPQNFSHRIYLRLMWLRINRELFSDFSKSFHLTEIIWKNQKIYITVYLIYHQDFSFFLEIFKNTPDKNRYFYYYIFSILCTYCQTS